MMKKYLYVLVLAVLCWNCGTGNKNAAEGQNSEAAEGWESAIPESFREEHYEEWKVVYLVDSIFELSGEEVDYAKVDSIVTGYIESEGIGMPSDRCARIRKIDELCKENFDISEYDYSNFGMMVAERTSWQFESYEVWLYGQEARKVLRKTKLVDIEKEMRLYGELNYALFDVCDSVAHAIEGSGSWIAVTGILCMPGIFERSMYRAILGLNPETGNELDVPLDLFDRECRMLVENYKPGYGKEPIDADRVVEKYRKAFHTWYAYRKSVASRLTDAKFKRAYESITYSEARAQLIDLKNRYNNYGVTSDVMLEMCLDKDCSDQELLNFNYEKRCEEAFGSDKD